MARQEHTVTEAQGPYGGYAAGSVDLTFLAADTVNKEQVPSRRGESILAQNSGTGAVLVTVTAVPDRYGRAVDLEYSVPAGTTSYIGPFQPHGWQQPDGYLYFEAAAADVSFAVIRDPSY